MLDNEETRRRILFALKSAPRGAQAAIAREAEITEQAVHGWKATGKIVKKFVPILARNTGRRADYFLDHSIRDEDSKVELSDEFKDWRSVLGYAQAAGLGEGAAAQEYAITHKLAFRADSLSKKHLNPDNLRVMYGKGDSMEPTIKDGDAILFDLADNTPRNRMIYVLLLDGAADEEYNVKRCKVSKGVVTFVADNPDGDHDWKEPRPAEGIKVIGRVRWTGGWVK